MSDAEPNPVAVTLTQRGWHALSFRVADLPDGQVACTQCWKRMTQEEWAKGEPCPGREETA